MNASLVVAALVAAAGLVLLIALYLRRRRMERRATWFVTGVAAAVGMGLCYVPHPRLHDAQVFGLPFPVAFSVFTPNFTALQPLGALGLASWILNGLLVRELVLAWPVRGGRGVLDPGSAGGAAAQGEDEPVAAAHAAPPRPRRRPDQ